MKEKDSMTIKLVHKPQHWNKRAGCTIPEAWFGYPDQSNGMKVSQIMAGTTREEALEYLEAEFPNCEIIT